MIRITVFASLVLLFSGCAKSAIESTDRHENALSNLKRRVDSSTRLLNDPNLNDEDRKLEQQYVEANRFALELLGKSESSEISPTPYWCLLTTYEPPKCVFTIYWLETKNSVTGFFLRIEDRKYEFAGTIRSDDVYGKKEFRDSLSRGRVIVILDGEKAKIDDFPDLVGDEEYQPVVGTLPPDRIEWMLNANSTQIGLIYGDGSLSKTTNVFISAKAKIEDREFEEVQK